MSEGRRVRYRLNFPPAAAPPPPAARPLPPVRQLFEPAAVAAGTGLVVGFAPLDSDRFVVVVPIVCVLATGYTLFGLVRFRGAAEGWGLVPPPRSDLEVAHGCLGVGILALASFAPIVLLHLFLERPALGHPAAYLVWCALQDFLFFSLFLRNLAGLITAHPAVLMTAVLFG